MQLEIDQNNILSINHPEISNSKEYRNVVSGYSFSSTDKWILVYHKKQIKVVSLKNLWDNMSVFFVTPRPENIETKLNLESFLQALCVFKWFDEELGLQYYFFPRFPINEIEKTNWMLDKLSIDIQLQKTNKWVTIPYFVPNSEDIQSIYSFLFWLTILYGKLDIKKWDLISAKIHIPLYGWYLSKKEEIQDMVLSLQKNWIFININFSSNSEWEICQISIWDYEILASFANFYQSIEKIQEISKQDYVANIKSELIEYISNKLDSDLWRPVEAKEDIIKSIKTWTLKILTK